MNVYAKKHDKGYIHVTFNDYHFYVDGFDFAYFSEQVMDFGFPMEDRNELINLIKEAIEGAEVEATPKKVRGRKAAEPADDSSEDASAD